VFYSRICNSQWLCNHLTCVFCILCVSMLREHMMQRSCVCVSVISHSSFLKSLDGFSWKLLGVFHFYVCCSATTYIKFVKNWAIL
jgi:hypothetical protein